MSRIASVASAMSSAEGTGASGGAPSGGVPMMKPARACASSQFSAVASSSVARLEQLAHRADVAAKPLNKIGEASKDSSLLADDDDMQRAMAESAREAGEGTASNAGANRDAAASSGGAAAAGAAAGAKREPKGEAAAATTAAAATPSAAAPPR